MIPEPTPSLDVLLAEAESASRHVNTIHVSFLVVATYVLVTVASTTHEQILRISPVSLPLLNVSVPILGFYLVVPCLVLLLHLNLLLQLYLLSRKLFMLDSCLQALGESSVGRQRLLLPSFPFTNMLIGGYRGLVGALLRAMVASTCLLLPLVVLLGSQIAFLPFHDANVTALQRLVVHLDLALLLALWPKIVTPAGSAREWWRSTVAWSASRAAFAGRRLARLLLRLRTRGPLTPRQNSAPAPPSWLATLLLASSVTSLVSFTIAVVPGELLEQWIAGALPRRWVFQGPGCPDGCWTVTSWMFDRVQSPLSRNLRLVNAVLVDGDVEPEALARMRHSPTSTWQPGPWSAQRQTLNEEWTGIASLRGLDLTNRDLRFADLRGAVLARADLRGAVLLGADLRGANLSAANLGPFDTREGERCRRDRINPPVYAGSRSIDAVACRTTLQGARLDQARLSWAQMEYVDFRQASVTSALLFEANLSMIYAYEADFSSSVLYKAELGSAMITRSKLGWADLRLSGLWQANLSGSSLYAAKLHGARLYRAVLDGARLHGARLRGANAQSASLRGVDLRSADLSAADFSSADLSGADLRASRIAGARFNGGDVSHADLRDLWRPAHRDDRDEITEEQDSSVAYSLKGLDKPDTLKAARAAVGARCEDDLSLSGCLHSAQDERYRIDAATSLATLACDNSDAAHGIIRRLVIGDDANYDLYEWPSFDERTLAATMSAPVCRARSTLDDGSRWLLERAARGLPSPPWRVPHELVYPQRIRYGPSQRREAGLVRGSQMWQTRSSLDAVLAFYSSPANRGSWQIERGTAGQPTFLVFNHDEPRRVFATIDVTPVVGSTGTWIEVQLQDLHPWTDIPKGLE